MRMMVMLADATGVLNNGLNAACSSACNSGSTLSSVLGSVANALIFLIGAISVIMILIGGLRYVLANGDPKATGAAKDTVLYAVIGVVVAIASYAIVHFVTNHIG